MAPSWATAAAIGPLNRDSGWRVLDKPSTKPEMICASRPEENSLDEIEITPAMIEAGKLAHATLDPDHFAMDEIIASIWKAMASAKSAEAVHLADQNPRLV